MIAQKPRTARQFKSAVPALAGARQLGTIDPKAGEFGAGLIKGAAIIARGAAQGHSMWIDRPMLQQVANAINASTTGIKSRFAHPFLQDGIGSAIGVYKNAHVANDVTRADLHIFKSAHVSPNGNIAQYIIDFAQESPASFGNSIAFLPDFNGEETFVDEHSSGPNYKFQSPDASNKDNLRHARLKQLLAIDAVDSPAASPSGFFGKPAGDWKMRQRQRGRQIEIEQDELMAECRAATGKQPNTGVLAKYRTASHEAGHIIGVYDSKARATAATIVPAGQTLGTVFFKFDDGGEDESFSRMVMSVIGRCAEEKAGFGAAELSGSDLETFCEYAAAACRQTGGAVSLDRINQFEAAARSYADRLLSTFEEKFCRLQSLLFRHGSLTESQISDVLDDWS